MLNKADLQKELGWPSEKKRPMICLPAGMNDALGIDVFKNLLPGLLSLDIEILVVGKGSQEAGALFTELSKEHSHRLHIVKDTEDEKAKMYAAADMALFLTDPTKMDELENCLKFGVVPVSPECKALKTYNPVQESGNAFIAEGESHWHIFTALVRAVETYRFPFDWKTIQKQCMEIFE